MDAPTKRRHQPGGAHPTRRKVVEEPFHPTAPAVAAAAPPSHLVGAIVEKGFSAAAPSSTPRPTVLPFPVARHRSHGPHWGPAAKDAGKGAGEEEDDEMDMDETDYQSVVVAAAGPVRRKERKGMDFSQWREFVDDTPPKRRQGKPAQEKKQSAQKTHVGAMTSKVDDAAAGERELEEGGMQLYSGNSREVSGAAALVSDMVSKKLMTKVELRGEMSKAGEVRDATLRGEGMELDGGELSIEAEINAENMARLAGMSAGEIAEAQADIMNKMNPALVEMLRRRGREKSGDTKGVSRDKGQESSGSQKATRATPGDWLTAGEHSGNSWKAWSERVEHIRSCRFTLDGDILGFQSSLEKQDGKKTHAESVAERDFLRTEGDPTAVGYTINEAVALTRSMVPGQRVLALQLLASILNRALQSLHKMDKIDNVKEMNSNDKFDDWQAVWAYALGPEPELVLSLRMVLDDNHDSVVLSCAKAINVMLSCKFNESYFEISEKVLDHGKDICTAPMFRSKPDVDGGFLEGGFWKYNTKPSNILPHYGDNDEEEGDEKHTIQDDVVVSGQDVAAGFVRMGILPRICFLLEMDSPPVLEDYLVSILVALARHSPQSANAILNCPRLIQNITKLLTKQGSMEIRSSQIKGVALLKVLSKYNRQTCLNFVNHGVFQQAMWHWYRKASTLEDWVRSGKEQCNLSSAMMVEQLRFWRTCISYGFCVAHFTDFFPVLCLWLSPPMFQKLSESNVLSEFSSVARESYLVLGALAQRLPLLHSVEQLTKQDLGVSASYIETWSWSHVVPMVDLALSWLYLNDIPYVCSLINVQNKNTNHMLEASYLVLVIASVLGMLNSILERISPDDTPDGKYCLPWIPDFIPKIGLAIISNGFFCFLSTDAVGHEEYPSFCGASLVQGLCYMRCQGHVAVSLPSVSCLQRLVQLSWSVDRVIQGTTKNCSELLKDSKTGIAGKILGKGISSLWHNDLLDLLTSLLPMISSQWSILQNTEMFGRGGPAPGVGFGWGACGGGFWSLKYLLAQLDSNLVLQLIKIFSAAPRVPVTLSEVVNSDNMTNTVVTASERISSVLGVSLIAGPGQISMLEKAFDILFQPSILKCLKSSVHGFACNMEVLKAFEWDITEDEYLLFSSVLNSHFRSRWLAIKKKHSDKYAGNSSSINVPKMPETLETIQEETELTEAVNQPCSTLVIEWAHQRLPLPAHWILSAVCCIDDPKGKLSTSANYILDVSRAGLIFLLGLEAISAAPCHHTPLVWKMHALSVSIRTSMDLLQENRSRSIFHALQELYGQHLDRLCQKYYRSQSVKKDESAGVASLEESREASSLEILRFQEKIHGSYTTFVESLVEQFAAVSYGDVIFGRQVVIYLHRRVEPTVRLAAWNALSNAYVLELLPPIDKCIGDIQGYLEPLEDDERILESYAKSWTSGVLDKAAQRDSMGFTLAKHHLSGFVFQCSASGKTLRNKLVKSLIRCYAQKRHHEAMMKNFVLQGIAQDSGCSNELDRRYEILKDACEMNSSLLTEVQRLKTSVGQ
ncbi:transcriptional elongation regulator MINIYO [Phragmites australis]|uniref:transcriptional elongation regulator MINIYO n=1 Tax=Phragmites australis TaxID=29695 RepID=UPI002D77BBB8|nr:transcriptional elongation regulator MINIYO [Phragmites australis]